MATILKEKTFLKEKQQQVNNQINALEDKNKSLRKKNSMGMGAIKVLLRKPIRFLILAALIYPASKVSEDLVYLVLFLIAATVMLTVGHSKRDYEKEIKKDNKIITKIMAKQKPWRKGLKGEDSVALALSKLPDSYYVIHDVTIHFKRRVQIDHVVVGPTGVFSIETKSMGGELKPALNGWFQGKTLIKSPQQQSEQGAMILSSMIDHPAQALVALSNPEAKWLGDQSEDCPVLYSTQLVNYMLNSTSRVYNPEDIAYYIMSKIIPFK